MAIKIDERDCVIVVKDGIGLYRPAEEHCYFFHFQQQLQPESRIKTMVPMKDGIILLALEGENFIREYRLDSEQTIAVEVRTVKCGGADSNCIEMHPSGLFYASCSGTSGTTSIILRESGEILCQKLLHGRHGPNVHRQTWSHPASLCFDSSGNFLLICDTGNDAVDLFEIGEGQMYWHQSMPLRPGSCPIEIVYGNDGYFYVLSDGLESIYCCKLNRDKRCMIPLRIVQPLSEFYIGLDVSCRNMRYSRRKNKLLFILPQGQGIGVFQIENGNAIKKSWLSLPMEISYMEQIGESIFFTAKNEVYRMIKGNHNKCFEMRSNILAFGKIHGE